MQNPFFTIYARLLMIATLFRVSVKMYRRFTAIHFQPGDDFTGQIKIDFYIGQADDGGYFVLVNAPT